MCPRGFVSLFCCLGGFWMGMDMYAMCILSVCIDAHYYRMYRWKAELHQTERATDVSVCLYCVHVHFVDVRSFFKI